MKTLSILLLFPICCLRAGTPLTLSVSASTPGTITVATGDVAELAYCSKGTSLNYKPSLEVDVGGISHTVSPFLTEPSSTDAISPVYVVGPATVQFAVRQGTAGVIYF